MKSGLMMICIHTAVHPSDTQAHTRVHTHTHTHAAIFAYRLLRADYSSNQNCHNQGRQLVRLGLCWFCVWPLASDGLEHSRILSTSVPIIPPLPHLLLSGSAVQLWNCLSLWVVYLNWDRKVPKFSKAETWQPLWLVPFENYPVNSSKNHEINYL